MDELYYILYFDRAERSENYPHDIILKALESFDSALFEFNTNIDHHIDLQYSNNFKETDYYPGLIPTLISNDLRLYRKYRNVFTESEFHAYCIDGPKKETIDRNKHLQFISDCSSLGGVYGEQTFAHFLRIKEGMYQEARMYVKSDYWDEEATGNRYEIEVESGWKTEKVKKTFCVIESKKISDKKYINTLINENNPSRLYMLVTDSFNEIGKTDKLDMSQLEVEEKGKKGDKTVFILNFKKS